jgi:hypothetical protein
MPEEHDFAARIGAKIKDAEQRLDRTALVGKPVEEAKAWCQAHGFPLVLVEQQGGASVLSFAPGRVRLTVDEGIVTNARLG